MSDIDKLGIKEVIENTIEYLKSRNVDGVHLSLDVDALDPLETPGTGTRVLGGLTYRKSFCAGIITSVSVSYFNGLGWSESTYWS